MLVRYFSDILSVLQPKSSFFVLFHQSIDGLKSNGHCTGISSGTGSMVGGKKKKNLFGRCKYFAVSLMLCL